MSASTSPRSTPLSIERIVDVACQIIERDGLAGLSMRKLGGELDVDPMAVYHHVAGKRELLALVTARTIATMTPPDPTAPWDTRVRQWAMNYWELVAKHRDLTLAGLADPEIAAGGLPSTESLITAIADSGLPADLVEPTAYIVVDAVHGAALSGVPTGTGRSRNRGLARLRATFAVGLDTIVAGIAARAATKRRRT
jgi:TetR/AcrR family tetracycline transcriptional repressor